MKWDAVGLILKQTKGKHQLTIKTCIKYVDKKSPVMRPNLQPKIYKSPVVATLSHVCNYKVQFCAFKGNAQNLPLRTQGLGASEKKKNKKNTIKYYKGANSLAPIFLSRRVKLIVTSERLNIFKKCFHQSKVK